MEFGREVRSKDGRVTRVSAELWDTSGDKKYEDCWPAITHKASGVILAYDPTVGIDLTRSSDDTRLVTCSGSLGELLSRS